MPEVGRFVSEDEYKGRISNQQSLNRYIYCVNNPIIRIDPMGDDSFVFYSAYDYQKDPGEYYLKTNFEDFGLNVAAKLEDKYGKGTVHAYSVSTAREFENLWNTKLATGLKIDEVVIIAHGSKDNFSFIGSDGNVSTILKTKLTIDKRITPHRSIYDLKYAEISNLSTYACNSGYLGEDGSSANNISTAFLKKDNGIKKVTSYDGYVKYDSLLNRVSLGSVDPLGLFTNREPKGRHEFTRNKYGGFIKKPIASSEWL